jgi:hypothetical protein
MGKKLPPNDLELYRRIDEVLHYLWDPIGVSGAPPARDEYQSYLPTVYRLVKNGAPEHEIATYLLHVERQLMGLEGNPRRASEAARAVLSYRSWIEDRDDSPSPPD